MKERKVKVLKQANLFVAVFGILAVVFLVFMTNYFPSYIYPGGSDTGTCFLMRNKMTGDIDCFGCGTRVCADPTLDWEPYESPAGPSIPYSCYVDSSGACALAQ